MAHRRGLDSAAGPISRREHDTVDRKPFIGGVDDIPYPRIERMNPSTTTRSRGLTSMVSPWRSL